MGSDNEFGPDTDAIRRWLSQRDSYRSDTGKHRAEEPPREAARLTDPLAHRATTAPPTTRRTAAHDVGRSIVEAIGEVTPASADAPVAPAPTGVEARLDALVTPAPAADPAPADGTEPAPDAEADPSAETPAAREQEPSGLSTDQVFTSRSIARRATGLVLILTLAVAVAAGYLAYQDPSSLNYGFAGIFAILTLIVWAVRASTTSSQVQVKRGVLEVRRGGGLETADLANPYTPIAILGTPERRNWRVLVERLDQPVIEIDASMVEPIAFTGLLLRLRPDLWDAAVDEARARIGLSRRP